MCKLRGAKKWKKFFFWLPITAKNQNVWTIWFFVLFVLLFAAHTDVFYLYSSSKTYDSSAKLGWLLVWEWALISLYCTLGDWRSYVNNIWNSASKVEKSCILVHLLLNTPSSQQIFSVCMVLSIFRLCYRRHCWMITQQHIILFR